METVTCTVHGWRLYGLKPGRPGSTDGVSAAAALTITSNGAMIHFDAEKRTDMFVQGAQQSERRPSSFILLPVSISPLLFAFASSLIPSMISVCQSAAHGNELHAAFSYQGWDVHGTVDTQQWVLNYELWKLSKVLFSANSSSTPFGMSALFPRWHDSVDYDTLYVIRSWQRSALLQRPTDLVPHARHRCPIRATRRRRLKLDVLLCTAADILGISEIIMDYSDRSPTLR